MKRLNRVLTAVLGLALASTLMPVSTASAEIAPVTRVSCPSVADINQQIPSTSLDKRRLVTREATPSTCVYWTKAKDGYLSFRFYPDVSTLQQVKDKEKAKYPPEFQYLFMPWALPALGKDAFAFADLGPASVYWELSPGAIADMHYNLIWDKEVVPVARLFRPMMEVYTIPGERTVNGRKWRTTCEDYSATVRCRTDIFATVIRRTPSGFVSANGWTFNSLTYRWSDRALWKTNPLGFTGAWTSAEGRQWRTECDTPTTGRGACRSYTLTKVIDRRGGRYVQENKWVFNNQVLFTN